MALQASGAISLNEIHIEAGGSSGSTASTNDADIRDLIDKSSGATMAFNEWYGASSFTARWVGAGGGKRKAMQYVNVATTGNASDFGDMLHHNNNEARQLCSTSQSITRGVWMGGNDNNSIQTLEYITFASTGDGTDFGDCGNHNGGVGVSNNTRGVHCANNYDHSEMVYITIASTGDTTDFGNLNQGKYYPGSCSSTTRGVIAGGMHPTNYGPMDQTDYITIASTGNASDYGDISQARIGLHNGSMGSNTRGLFAGGGRGSENQNASNGPVYTIDYITIASTGNASDFGDLTTRRIYGASGSSKIRAIPRAGGYSYASPGRSTTMDYVTIASTGNASDFGDLIDGEQQWAGASNGCGGTSSS